MKAKPLKKTLTTRYVYIVMDDEDEPIKSFSTREKADKYLDDVAKDKGMSKREVRNYARISKSRLR